MAKSKSSGAKGDKGKKSGSPVAKSKKPAQPLAKPGALPAEPTPVVEPIPIAKSILPTGAKKPAPAKKVASKKASPRAAAAPAPVPEWQAPPEPAPAINEQGDPTLSVVLPKDKPKPAKKIVPPVNEQGDPAPKAAEAAFPKRIVTPTKPAPQAAKLSTAKAELEAVAVVKPKATKPAVKTPAKKSDKLRVLLVTAECVPYAKTGGLGDAVAGLAKALHRLGHDVRIVLPLYSIIDYVKHGLQFQRSACIHMGHGEENWIGLHTAKLDGEVDVWFIDHGRFFHRGGIYSDGPNDYTDNAYRFGLLSKAALQICKDLEFIPDVMHLHDWQATPAAAFLKTWDNFASPLSQTASVVTIHNIGHQGKYHASVMRYYGLGDEHFTSDKFEDFSGVNLLKAGIHFADAITTVSPTHAREILEPIGGQGLERHLQNRAADLSGILNGVDAEHWNPATDKLLPARYSADNLKGKAVCKEALQKRFGLEPRPDLPLFGIVSRFAQQKGFDLLTGALPRALNGMAMQLVVLGTGNPETEDFFNWLHAIYPTRVGTYIGFSNELSHLIEAGSDFFLMPSLYEPCGLNQIYSLAYGTLPVVRATGGLADTVQNYNEATGDGTGFVFDLPNAAALHDTIGWAVSTWYDRPHHYKKLQQTAMKQEFPWSKSAEQYVEVYKKAIKRRRA